ncbi:MAG: glycosyl hydrolase family 28 protein [Eubacteriales bacterium]
MSYNIYSIPQGEALSNLYAFSINGQAVPLHEAFVSAFPFNRRWPGHQRSFDQAEPVAYASFAMDEPVEISVKPQRAFSEAIVRPLSKGIVPKVNGDNITFTLTEAGGYTLELDGYHNALHIFADPIKTYNNDFADENFLYFGAGVHDAGMITLKSNQTLFVDEGAVLYATIHTEDTENIKILGRGIINNIKNKETILFELDKLGDGTVDVCNSERLHTIQMKNCKNIEIDGITIHDSLVYNIALYGCEDVLIDNVKIIGCWRYNSDGIDLHNCSRCVVKNCFVRTYDDSICIKGHDGLPQICGDTLVENCVVWCDWGKSLEIGAETRAEEMKNVTFRNCDLIRNSSAAMDIYNVDYGDVHDIVFEDIRVEYDPVCHKPMLQKNDDESYPENPNSTFMPWLMNAEIVKHMEYSEGLERRGKNHDITFRNIYVISAKMPPSRFNGYDKNHQTYDVNISKLFYNGNKLSNFEQAAVLTEEYASDVTIE